MRNRRLAFIVLSAATLLGSTAAGAGPVQFGAQAVATPAADEITYTMPAAWVVQPVQGGPDLKAHYVYMSGGRPYGEMFLTQNPAPTGQTLDQVFEEAIGRARPQMPYYQARSTQKVTIAGIPAVVHEFTYQPNGAGVSFTGRSYTFVSGGTVFTFFFQALNMYATALAGECTKVMSTLKPVAKPAPQPVGGLTAEDMGLVFSLPTGWKRDDNPAGSKYRYLDADGAPLGSLLIFKPMSSQRLMDLFGGTEDDILDAALSERVDRELKGYERYQPAATTKRKIAGYDGLVHDFTFSSQGQPVFSRWVIFAVPGKAADPTVKVAPTVQQFAFTVLAADRAAEFKRQWDGILDSMRVKEASVPPPPPAKQ